MKRTAPLIALLLLIPVLSFAGPAANRLLSVTGAAASCTTSNDSAQFDKEGSVGDTSTWACIKWILGSNITITEYVVDITYNGNNGTITMCLLPHDSGPDLPSGTTCITGTSKGLTEAAFSGEKQTVAWTLDTPKDVDAGTYWVCNVTDGVIGRSYYYDAGSERSCYGTSSCGTGGTATVNVQVNGCAR